IVLADFGMAKQAQTFMESPTSNELIGTTCFQPPELPHHSTKGDVWSAGAIMFLMMAGYIPTEGLPDEVAKPGLIGNLWYGSLETEQINSPPGLGIKGYSKGLESCLEGALTENARWRSTSLQLLHKIEHCRDRASSRWEELRPWVYCE
ncbi:MAG: hypothetical protein Q9169_008566, partial [Polycauliona sp. 2 TL-2023]